MSARVNLPPAATRGSVAAEGGKSPPASVPSARRREAIQQDFCLAQRCFAGEVAAWEELHRLFNDKLTTTIRSLLRGRSTDFNLAEELAAQVWYALIADDGALMARFDPNRGARLITYMRMIAREVINRHFRSEHRRTAREIEALRRTSQHRSLEQDYTEVSLDEFLATLSQRERQFCQEYLCDVQPSTTGAAPMSRANIWQRTHRLYRRLLAFMG